MGFLNFNIMKICIRCKLEKEESEFYVDKRAGDGLFSSCKRCISVRQKEHRKSDKYKICKKKYQDSDKCRVYQKEYKQNNDLRERKRKYQKMRVASNIQFKLACNLRCRFSSALKKGTKSGSAVRDLGCTIAELKLYFEERFKLGMTWDNHGIGKGKWHIDHEYPLSKVDLTDRKQLLRVCHYTNLQPLWSEENIRKGNKIY